MPWQFSLWLALAARHANTTATPASTTATTTTATTATPTAARASGHGPSATTSPGSSSGE